MPFSKETSYFLLPSWYTLINSTNFASLSKTSADIPCSIAHAALSASSLDTPRTWTKNPPATYDVL